MEKYSAREIELMSKVPPDAWQVITFQDGEYEFGDITTLDEALAELAELYQHEDKFDSIEIAPMWNSAYHEDVI